MRKRGVTLAVIMDEEMMRRALMRIAHQISERHRGIEGLVLVGVLTRGTPMAYRIADNLARIEGARPPVESIDVGTYRDDRERTRMLPAPWRARQPVENQVVILVDDVLFTGRTVRAALDAIIDGGRPRAVELAVLVDRGHRELPIRADYVGKNIPTAKNQLVQVMLKEIDGRDQVELIDEGE
ncbi:MAG: bifunctional pyr operon transcriptional regulator/uracil phosphoribosyltransferase PyrR [Sulfobacillus sp.]|nr:bifunctional pyr operon transcriptional regulator/uracil phosphoribosyltransferase PyrR [Sulfobacillus sp.]